MPPVQGGRRVGRQRWRDLLFLHQAVPLETLRGLVPRRLEIDTFEGTAWATLIPFAVFDSRPMGAPRPLAMSFLDPPGAGLHCRPGCTSSGASGRPPAPPRRVHSTIS